MKKIIVLSLLCFTFLLGENKMQVFQPPTSTCPKSWFTDMQTVTNQLDVITVMNVKNLKKEIGIPRKMQSCNTSLMGDYVFEGNVPSLAIKDFLANTPKDAIGLALPAYENDKDPKKVFVIFKDKTYKEFGRY